MQNKSPHMGGPIDSLHNVNPPIFEGCRLQPIDSFKSVEENKICMATCSGCKLFDEVHGPSAFRFYKFRLAVAKIQQASFVLCQYFR